MTANRRATFSDVRRYDVEIGRSDRRSLKNPCHTADYDELNASVNELPEKRRGISGARMCWHL